MTNPEKLSEQVLDEATDWLVTLHSGEVNDEQYQQFEQWKNQKPENLLAIEQVQKIISGLNELPENLKHQSFAHSKNEFHQTLKNNTLLSLIGLFILTFFLYQLPWSKWQADYHTEIGEIKNIPLQDGSQLILASNSYINVEYTKKSRTIKLITGEVYIKTASDSYKRPFFVNTSNGELEALGTQFSVLHENHKTKLNVYQHAVAIHAHHQSSPQIVQQGHRTVFDDHFISKSIPLKNDQPYWTQHLLVVENWPLKKVLHELYRYQDGHYFIDKNVQNISVSGIFSLSDPQQSLETLASAHQLELDFYSSYVLYVKKLDSKK